MLISILSLLDDAEPNSPANVDAGKMLRMHPDQYKERVKRDLVESQKDIPEGFIMPTQHTAAKREVVDNDFSWSDSECEDDFGGSDSDEEMTFDEDGDEDEDHDKPADTDSSGDE